MKQILFFLSLIYISQLAAQEIPHNGVKSSRPNYVLLKNATIIASSDKTYTNASLLLKDDKIIDVGLIIIPPNDAVVIDCSDKFILPAFIELRTDIGLPKQTREQSRNPYPQLNSSKKGAYYWNESVHPEFDANFVYTHDEKSTKELIDRGFGYALSHSMDGVARGSAAFVSLHSDRSKLGHLTQASCFSFKKGTSGQTYPSSQMGSIALLRQAFYDAEFYSENKQELNLSLEALHAQRKGLLFLETDDKYEVLRGSKIANEFDFQFIYFGSGNEYQIASQLKNQRIVLPLTFPEAYDVKDPYVARQIPLSDLKHWELAPRNAALLQTNEAQIALTGHGTKSAKDFWTNLRKAIDHGLSESDALNALTINPARMLGVDTLLGSIQKGRFASFMIYDAHPLRESAVLLESWIQGQQTVHQDAVLHDIAGKYNMNLDGERLPFEIEGKGEKLSGKITYKHVQESGVEKDSTIKMNVTLVQHDVTLQFVLPGSALKGNISLRGKVNTKLGVFEGEGALSNGKWVTWTAIKNTNGKKDKPEDKKPTDMSGKAWYPNMAYGFDSIPMQQNLVIRNATLWTNEADGIITDGVIVVSDGKITYVGQGNQSIPSGARVIDAQGKHVTSGIIDEHSHIAISRGVNEGGQAISAEVSIGDVVNPDDINIYRQLSGGVTAAQLLHGSANPIGGQSALIKLKWGHSPDELLIPNAPKFIKFALGENVKQANWGDYNTVRFPQTRMGVEQVYYDGFNRASSYAKRWKSYTENPTGPKPYKDLELEVLSEILAKQRFISCHSYVQSEINMLMHVADSFGFHVNTFTHILEGYKLADKMAEHGAGGSTFSDWWAYKFEVNDAIPYNASLMHAQGVTVAINSDDAEMGRRLNQEAAKAVKYGGMSEQDAWKTVTLNPAKLLHLDDRMGSLKVGKDADIVIWTNNPLSVHSKVVYTIVDGKILFDHERDELQRTINQAEKARIITKMLEDNSAGGPTKPFLKRKKSAYHCDTLGEEMSTEENHH